MKNLPRPDFLRQMIEDRAGQMAVYYLEALVSAALDAGVGAIDAQTAGKVLLAEELLLILTGYEDVEQVRIWMSSRGIEPYHGADVETAEAPA